MTADRPYRRAISQGEALAELRACAQTQFDPQVVEAIQRLFVREMVNSAEPHRAAGWEHSADDAHGPSWAPEAN